ncbi:MAG: 1-deoxy-D-xylulose-5-phosphate reductoisomerase [Bacteroidia bacterium]|nr:1-deoxy-D-xylulose-5-phosphate reductoisomerase [Bacteroidia bacterium]
MKNVSKIALLGSTGSIGRQSLEIIRLHPEQFSVSVLTANSNVELLIEQAIEFKPETVIISEAKYYPHVKDSLAKTGIQVLGGEDALNNISEVADFDTALVALVGFSGLRPTINALNNQKKIALANKETLVVAGKIIKDLAKKNQVPILPIDSEHSAIFQCLVGEDIDTVEKLILTASGGPFRNYSADELLSITPEQALKHPNWSMGAKITIDSATLMNKGLEVIEAHWLFDIDSSKIEVIVHPQSIIHSIVQFIDGSQKAQLGLPDMRVPIQYALAYPKRIPNQLNRYNYLKPDTLTFELPNKNLFPCLNLAYEALAMGGNAPCILNAANEIAVSRFLNHQIYFTQIPDYIEKALKTMPFISAPSLADLFYTDLETRQLLTYTTAS